MLKDFWNFLRRETADDIIIGPMQKFIDRLHRSAALHHELADTHAAQATLRSELASKARMEALKAKAFAVKFTAHLAG